MRLAIVLTGLFLAPLLPAQDGWRVEQALGQWAPRTDHASVEFDGKLWIINGWAGNIPSGAPDADNIWSSSDGVSWLEALPAVPWSRRKGHEIIEFDNRLWVLGGRNPYGGPGHDPLYPEHRHDVWSSPDGVNWTLETIAPWHGRGWFASVVYDGRIWVMGGITRTSPAYFALNDVWSSPDGVNWTQEVAAAAWSPRSTLRAVVHDNRMWVMGGGLGGPGNLPNDVWSSTDGVNWTQETSSAPWIGRTNPTFLAYRGRMWVACGLADNGYQFLNDVWSSVDGANWQRESPDASLPARADHASAVFNNRLWVLGGGSSIAMYNDVWSYGLHIHTDAATGCLVNTPYVATFAGREGDGPYLWSVASGSLPSGLAIDTSSSSATISLSGTPIEAGEWTFTVRVEDQATGDWAEKSFTLTVNPPPEPKLPNHSPGGGASCQAAPNQSGTGGQGTSTAVLWLAWLAALTAATIALRRRGVD